LGLTDCDPASSNQKFDIIRMNDNRYEIHINSNDDANLCIVVSTSSRSAGPIYKARDLYLDDCDDTESEYKTWSIKPIPPGRNDDESEEEEDDTSEEEEDDTSTAPEVGFPALCFPRDATVYRREKQQSENKVVVTAISMNELSIGDKILVDTSGTFETVYSFGHKNPNIEAEYLQFYTTNNKNKKLEISSIHMVSIRRPHEQQQQILLPSDQVVVGDYLLLQQQQDSTATTTSSWEEITAIRTVKRKGAYAPFTTSGMLVVNGYAVSSYVALFNDADISYSLQQYLAHALQFPHRFICNYFHTKYCQNETYETEEGISTWVSMPYRYIIQQKQQHSVGTDREISTLLSFKYIMLLMSMVIISLMFTVIETLLLWITTTNTNTTMTGVIIQAIGATTAFAAAYYGLYQKKNIKQ